MTAALRKVDRLIDNHVAVAVAVDHVIEVLIPFIFVIIARRRRG